MTWEPDHLPVPSSWWASLATSSLDVHNQFLPRHISLDRVVFGVLHCRWPSLATECQELTLWFSHWSLPSTFMVYLIYSSHRISWIGPCNRAKYTIPARELLRAMDPTENWQTSVSPSLQVRTVLPTSEFPQRPTQLGMLPWWQNNFGEMSGWEAVICPLLWRVYLGIQAAYWALKISLM